MDSSIPSLPPGYPSIIFPPGAAAAPVVFDDYAVKANAATTLVGFTTMTALSYGFATSLSVSCALPLLRRIFTRSETVFQQRRAILSFNYILLMLLFGSLYCGANSRLIRLEYVTTLDGPDSTFPHNLPPSSLTLTNPEYRLRIMSNVSFVAISWMNDALLPTWDQLWRLSVIYNNSSFRFPVVSLATISMLISVGLGFAAFLVYVPPESKFFSTQAKLKVAFFILSTGGVYTIAVTCLIIGRILYFQMTLAGVMGQEDLGLPYLTVTSIVVESSALHMLCGSTYLVMFLLGNPTQNIIYGMIPEVQIISQLMIIRRVLSERSWLTKTTQPLSRSIRFHHTSVTASNFIPETGS
ncbi:hypothetical protein CVT24_012817 [Panaeolus cyanescens]|uniref:Uncharacterized protein n=1 Tax=Panaeolus cyanescens TaxID=181874 RepID=A0A409YJQ1_9AGAR|nr:hypothetical protein CVT24_012817 [Panaeolus cyanescens]